MLWRLICEEDFRISGSPSDAVRVSEAEKMACIDLNTPRRSITIGATTCSLKTALAWRTMKWKCSGLC